MPPEINITQDQIMIAEKLLLPVGKVFDPERISFIKDLSTCDLHAVPGSGKTTALLAKLVGLEQHLPFADRSGILVISHTNAAVDEIRAKLGHVCPRLFSYPNFVGTIQAFTDAFLSIPYYKMLYRRRPVRIDDEIYIENHFPDFKLKAFLDRRGDGGKLLYNYRLRDGENLTLELENTPFVFAKKTETYQKILKIKKEIRANGFLCFDDAYILAQEYITQYPGIIGILKKRFRYVFVDEMQDMDKHQYQMLESLFGDGTDICYQRIGDKNQAIFNDESEMADIWEEQNVKELNGSHRLHAQTASIVQSLALSPIAVIGNRRNPDETLIDIKPIMLVYDTATIGSVIPMYATIIKEHIDAGKINPQTDGIFKAIAWTTSKSGDRADIIKLNHYQPGFSKEHIKLKINYPCLESYLFFYDLGVGKLASIRKNLLNAFLRILRLEKIMDPVNVRSFTKRSLIEYLKLEHPEFYREFKLRLYKITTLNADKKRTEALNLLKSLVTDLLGKWGKTVTLSKNFISGKHIAASSDLRDASAEKANSFVKDGISIEVTTVHAVKGQTHTCTLYMESFYQKDVGKKGQYESTRIADQLQGKPIPSDAHEFIKQSLKMSYVGFSRPTHLLCFAVHKSNFDALYAGKPNLDRWVVKHVALLPE